MRQKPAESVASFYNRFMTLNFQIDKKVEPWLHTTFRNALQPEIKDKLVTMADASLQQLRTIAVGIESNSKPTSLTKAITCEVEASEVPPQNQRFNAPRNITCSYCKRPGHVVADCRKLVYNKQTVTSIKPTYY